MIWSAYSIAEIKLLGKYRRVGFEISSGKNEAGEKRFSKLEAREAGVRRPVFFAQNESKKINLHDQFLKGFEESASQSREVPCQCGYEQK